MAITAGDLIGPIASFNKRQGRWAHRLTVSQYIQPKTRKLGSLRNFYVAVCSCRVRSPLEVYSPAKIKGKEKSHGEATAPPPPPRIAMYGHQENSRSSKKQQWTVTNDLANILALYFPQIDFSLEDSKLKLQLTSELVQFFSDPIGESIISQVLSLYLHNTP